MQSDRAIEAERELSYPIRTGGYLPLKDYGALGDGRSVALSGADGSIDWWCVPKISSPPLFDRLIDAGEGGYFVIQPEGEFQTERYYLPESNVLETIFQTRDGKARLTESLNSSHAGRLPWSELARRIEGLEGSVRFSLKILFSRRADTASPYRSQIGRYTVFHVRDVLGLFLHTSGVTCDQSDEGVTGQFVVRKGERQVLAIVAGQDEPLVVPPIEDIDARIDISDRAWQLWSSAISYQGPYRDGFVRSALALKFLLFSPSGAIAAAATTSLPEKIGGKKNYDYRFAWIRDAGYTIKAFLAINAQPEAQAAFTWLLKRLQEHGPLVCYTLEGQKVSDVQETGRAGYRNSRPVVTGNQAASQHQHGIYGDIFGTAWRFIEAGNILDNASAELLSHIADECTDIWRQKDAGIWELSEEQHYTFSKISCWQALARAVELADRGQLPTTCRDRWVRERDRIAAWIDEHCWSDNRQSYVMYPGSEKLDAAMALAVRFRFENQNRLRQTLAALDQELGTCPYHYRYSDMSDEEGCFLACSFWIAEAWALLGHVEKARKALSELTDALQGGVGVWTEMVNPDDGSWLGNMPQGLTHLAHVNLLETLVMTHETVQPQ
ncbi:glycoside hydrolase family 15 protein [Gluconobacter sp. LMG 31484]|uniref:Glycoside hydrolase family 15 protein n=1 Tax=Gluconobacter vitians TaxID=2728102 RepID=A0ABR9Y853_9PROT|nr:glycoside hydrolase family 15 protein [Gluconobacter vitians]MBF0860015.1 glycoside hydrolase family 15 protein [Gluconobacter vitians]